MVGWPVANVAAIYAAIYYAGFTVIYLLRKIYSYFYIEYGLPVIRIGAQLYITTP